MTRIICIEGCHGCGKTAIIKKLASLGYHVIDEGFVNMPTYNLPPQCFTQETLWVTHWVERVLKLNAENPGTYFADRSPYSAMLYARNGGNSLNAVIDNMLADLKKQNIEIIMVRVDVDENILWGRIVDRLEREPNRHMYDEDSRQLMYKVLNFYAGFTKWDFVLENNTRVDNTVKVLIEKYININ